ncbi:hypothetical protein EON65_58810, partial [archaeon]
MYCLGDLFCLLSPLSLQTSGRLDTSSSVSPRSPTTPRFAFNESLVVKDGVLFQSAENSHKPLGPGYYAPSMDNSLVRPSFNVRAS